MEKDEPITLLVLTRHDSLSGRLSRRHLGLLLLHSDVDLLHQIAVRVALGSARYSNEPDTVFVPTGSLPPGRPNCPDCLGGTIKFMKMPLLREGDAYSMSSPWHFRPPWIQTGSVVGPWKCVEEIYAPGAVWHVPVYGGSAHIRTDGVASVWHLYRDGVSWMSTEPAEVASMMPLMKGLNQSNPPAVVIGGLGMGVLLCLVAEAYAGPITIVERDEDLAKALGPAVLQSMGDRVRIVQGSIWDNMQSGALHLIDIWEKWGDCDLDPKKIAAAKNYDMCCWGSLSQAGV